MTDNDRSHLGRRANPPSFHEDLAEVAKSEGRWFDAAQHYRDAAGASIGHNRAATYEACAESCLAVLASETERMQVRRNLAAVEGSLATLTRTLIRIQKLAEKGRDAELRTRGVFNAEWRRLDTSRFITQADALGREIKAVVDGK